MSKEEREARRKARREAREKRKEALAEARTQRAIRATARKSRALGFIQVAWVVEAMGVIAVACIYTAVLPQWRIELFGKIIIPLIGAIAGEGIVAFAGPNVKKWLQGKYGVKPEENSPDSFPTS